MLSSNLEKLRVFSGSAVSGILVLERKILRQLGIQSLCLPNI